jgi:hypothetical protein
LQCRARRVGAEQAERENSGEDTWKTTHNSS